MSMSTFLTMLLYPGALPLPRIGTNQRDHCIADEAEIDDGALSRVLPPRSKEHISEYVVAYKHHFVIPNVPHWRSVLAGE